MTAAIYQARFSHLPPHCIEDEKKEDSFESPLHRQKGIIFGISVNVYLISTALISYNGSPPSSITKDLPPMQQVFCIFF